MKLIQIQLVDNITIANIEVEEEIKHKFTHPSLKSQVDDATSVI